jgi:Ca2+-binding RTX toxin-like protein
MANFIPTLTGLNSPSFSENGVNATPQIIDPAVTLADADGNFGGATLTVSGLLPEDVVSLNHQGTGAGQIGFSGGLVTYEGVVIGVAAGGTGETFRVTFTLDATTAAVDALIENLTYANASDTPTLERALTIHVADATGAAASAPNAIVQRTGAANPFNGLAIPSFPSPTFADLDGDGDLDAIVGDFNGDFSYFRNTGTAAAPTFVQQTGAFDPATGAGNPLNGIDVNALATPTFTDVDGDGDLDGILAGGGSGTQRYFRNQGSAVAPNFVEQTGGNNPFAVVDVDGLATAAPTLADLDGDGDLDLLEGGSASGALYYYLNTGTATTPVYVLQTGAENPFGFNVGSSARPVLGDVDRDGDFDLIVGRQSGGVGVSGTVLYFRNVGTPRDPLFVAQTANNPFASINVGFNAQPAFADLDGDGDLDVAVGGAPFGSNFVNYYENTTPGASTAQFVALTGIRNPLNGVDVDTVSAPAFADLDGDGDVDATVGRDDGTLSYLENTGSLLAPVFVERTGAANPFNGFDVVSTSAPSFADLDGDGDQDAIVGDLFGRLNYFENTGSATAAAFVQRTGAANPFNGVDFDVSKPTFADIDGDGDLDAFVGAFDGIINYLENTGTAVAPVFAAGATNPLGGVNVGPDSHSAPSFADLDRDGDLDAVIGWLDGALRFFDNIGSAAAPIFVERSGSANPFDGVDVGESSAPSFADIDGDADLDAIVGGSDGTLRYYRNNGSGFALVVNVTPDNDPLAITSNGGGSTAALGVAENITAVTTVTSADVDGPAAVYSIVGGADAARFTINAATGGLSFITGPNFEAPTDVDGNNSYVVQVRASDGGSVDDQVITVTVGNVAPLIVGTSAANTLVGTLEEDTVFSLGATDRLLGLSGNDRLDGGVGNDILDGGVDNDNLLGAAGNDALVGGAGNDTVNGGVGNDVLTGGVGSDRLIGAAGNDRLNGGTGNDLLTGGAGRDIMTGGAGADDFDFNSVGEIGRRAATRDVISDFVLRVDDIDLSTIDANGSAAGNGAFRLLAREGATFTGVRGQLRFDQQVNKTIIEGDVNGDGRADFQLQLTGLKALTAGDFVL